MPSLHRESTDSLIMLFMDDVTGLYTCFESVRELHRFVESVTHL